MAKRNEIISYLNDYLEISTFKDMLVNGLLVEGKENVKKVIVGVSPSYQIFEKAVEKKADMIICHHGIFMDPEKGFRVTHVMKNRLKILLQHDISFVAYHLPLDAHPKIGNNIQIVKKMGLKDPLPVDIGFIGHYPKKMDFRDFVKKIDKVFNARSYVLAYGPKKIKKVGVISGGASSMLKNMLHFHPDIDTYVCGDIKEHIPEFIREAGINFIHAGHYNTEKFGIKNVGKLLEKKFGLNVEFVDVPNEV